MFNSLSYRMQLAKTTMANSRSDPHLCNDCVGSYGVAQCMAGCPTSQGCTPTIPGLINLASQTIRINIGITGSQLMSI